MDSNLAPTTMKRSLSYSNNPDKYRVHTKELPVWCTAAILACGTSDGSLSAHSLASPLDKKQKGRLLEIEKTARLYRIKEMKKRGKLTKKYRESAPLPGSPVIAKERKPELSGPEKVTGNIFAIMKAKKGMLKLHDKLTKQRKKAQSTGKNDDGTVYVDPKDIALLRACGINREAATIWLQDGDPEDKYWTPFEKRDLPHHNPWPPWPKPGLLVSRKNIMDRLKQCPAVTKQALDEIVKDEITYRPHLVPGEPRKKYSISLSTQSEACPGPGPPAIYPVMPSNLAPVMRPEFSKEEHLRGRFVRRGGDNSTPGPLDYGDVSQCPATRHDQPGAKAGWHSRTVSVASVVPTSAASEPGPDAYHRVTEFARGVPGPKINSRGLTDTDIKERTARELPGPGEYSIENDRILSRFHAPAAFISHTCGESDLEKTIREASKTPGPIDYQKDVIESSPAATIGGGRFSTAFPMTSLEIIEARSKEIPGPNSYFASTGGVPQFSIPPGAPKFSTTVPKTPMDLLMLRSAETPGPGQYRVTYPGTPGGAISKSELKTDAEIVATRSAKVPGPDAYADYFLRTSADAIGGGRFSTAKPLTELEILQLRSAETPGPGQYPISFPMKSGGTISIAKLKSSAEVIAARASQTPGPDAYADYYLKPASERNCGGRFSTARPLTHIELVQLRSAETPAPHDYAVKSPAEMIGGGRFSTARPLTQLEIVQLRSAETPAPHDYVLKSSVETVGGGTFSSARPMTHLQLIQLRSSETPAPHDYVLKASTESISGGRFSTAKPPSELEIIQMRSSETPAPHDYQSMGM